MQSSGSQFYHSPDTHPNMEKSKTTALLFYIKNNGLENGQFYDVK